MRDDMLGPVLESLHEGCCFGSFFAVLGPFYLSPYMRDAVLGPFFGVFT